MLPSVSPRARRRVSGEEASLWREVTRSVRPLGSRVVLPATESIPEAPSAAPPPSRPVAPAPTRPNAVNPGLPGLDKRSEERLRKGDMPIDGRLDLHGMTQDRAHAALRTFVRAAAERGDRCLLIITGKGGFEGLGVLRREVPRWLEQLRPLVLRAVPAQPRHGGNGALYLLLKRRR